MNSKTSGLRAIPGAPGYLAGADGRIWSTLDPNEPLRCLKPTLNKRLGRYQIRFHLSEGSKWRCYVHTAVALAFHGVPEGYEPGDNEWQVHHINENRQDNRASNLRWVTRCEHELIHASGATS